MPLLPTPLLLTPRALDLDLPLRRLFGFDGLAALEPSEVKQHVEDALKAHATVSQ